MEKNVAIGLGALVVLAAIVLVFMGTGSSAPVSETDSQAAAAQEGVEGAAVTEATDGLFEGSFAELMRRGGSFECSFDEVVNGAQSSGIVYVSGDKIRLNFSASAAEAGAEPTRGAMIQKDNTMYMWSDAMPQGIKMAIPEGQSVSSAPMSGEMFDQNMKMKYACKAWTPNNAWFEVPPTIEFMTF